MKDIIEELNADMVDKNDIVKIKFEDLEFEIDMWGDIIFLPEEIIELFAEDSHVEYQPVNLFFRRLVDNWRLKKEVNNL